MLRGMRVYDERHSAVSGHRREERFVAPLIPSVDAPIPTMGKRTGNDGVLRTACRIGSSLSGGALATRCVLFFVAERCDVAWDGNGFLQVVIWHSSYQAGAIGKHRVHMWVTARVLGYRV